MTHLIANDEAFASLKACVVVITGGAAGIGRSAVEQFAAHGAKIVFGDVQDAAGDDVAKNAGPNVIFRHCDASSYSDQLALFAAAKEKHGRVDIAVANAGIVQHKDIFTPDSDWTQEPRLAEVDVNLKGVLFTARIAQGYIRQGGNGGDIILTSSISGFKECAGLTVYTASKHGVVGLVRGLNLAARRENIRVNVVCPWMTQTGMTVGFEKQWMGKGLPTNQASDVARSILICASANRASQHQMHGNVVTPFAGKIVWVGGGESYEIEDRLQALEPEWLGTENSRVLEEGQRFLESMGDWDRPKNDRLV